MLSVKLLDKIIQNPGSMVRDVLCGVVGHPEACPLLILLRMYMTGGAGRI